ncbi:hypothetical protein [Haloarcula sp. JP-L23]|uniref:hypothetical protein n=1 Tax=Haloarcula sp. JP-L23 TaxID=2716717 RepID=UPI00140F1D28|nr:hypothetical protein G9465_17030 [Haloarcula sp. JP-L23]
MARSRTLALAVALLFVTAGCQSLGTEAADGPETVTPAPVPTTTTTPVGGDTGVDTGRIADRHRAALDGRSYTITVAFTVQYDNGSTGRLRDRFVVGPEERYRWNRRVAGPYPERVRDHAAWQSESGSAIRRTLENGTTSVGRGDVVGPSDPSLSFYVARLIRGFDVSAEGTPEGRRLYGTSDEARSVPLPAGLTDGHDSAINVRIRDGVVTSLAIGCRARLRETGQPVWFRFDFFVSDVGGAPPTEPSWATTPTATPAADRTETVTPS